MTSIASSSPSTYSRPNSHVSNLSQPSHGRISIDRVNHGLGMFSESDYESEGEPFKDDLSVLSGPRVRKFAQAPWSENQDDSASISQPSHNGFSRMIKAAAARTNQISSKSRHENLHPDSMSIHSTRKGSSTFLNKPKQTVSNTSEISISSSQTATTLSSRQPITPRLSNSSRETFSETDEETLLPIARANMTPTKTSLDHPMAAELESLEVQTSGTSKLNLISLEKAQERERGKHRRTDTMQTIVSTRRSREASSGISGPITNGDVTRPSHDTALPPLPKQVKPKKSGLMRYLTKDRQEDAPAPKLPTPPLLSSAKASHSVLPSSSSNTVRATTPEGPPMEKPLPRPQVTPPKKEWKKDQSKVALGLLGSELHKPRLELRPISMNFSNGFDSDYFLSSLRSVDDAASSAGSSPLKSSGPTTPQHEFLDFHGTSPGGKDDLNSRKVYQLQIFELEAQIRDLREELEQARGPKAGGCDACGCTCGGAKQDDRLGVSVMDRARAKTGGPRGVFGSGSLYERE